MIFVLREVLALRALGLRIETASINPPDRTADQMTDDEASEAARTYFVKSHGIAGAVNAHFLALLRNFVGYWRGLRLVLRLGGLDLKRLYFNFMYFTEALMVGRWMRRQRQRTSIAILRSRRQPWASMCAVFGFGIGFSLTSGPDEFYDAKGQYLAQNCGG